VDEAIKGVDLGYGRQLYFRCLLKYMVICAFENHPSIPSFLETQIAYIGYGQFYLSIAALPVYLYLIAANNSVIIMCLCPQNIIDISLSRKNSHWNMLSKRQEYNTFCVTNKWKILNIHTRILDIMNCFICQEITYPYWWFIK
jgi:hypothetical protein